MINYRPLRAEYWISNTEN